MSSAVQLLREYLLQESSHGVTHVSLTQEAREALHKLKQPVVTRPSVQSYSAGQATVARTDNTPPSQSSPQIERRTEQSVAPNSQPAAPVQEAVLSAATKRTELDRMMVAAQNSAEIRSLGTLRDTMVFSIGSPDAEIIFVGEAPGAEEEKQQEPFVGPAGQLLTKIIQAMGLRRSDVYISNICKFRPMIDDGRMQGTKNRAPTRGEMQACLPFITAEINLIQPKVIVALGSTAATGLGIEGTVGKLRGKFSEFRTIPVMVTYHPSYLLRREQEDGGGIAEKRLVWEDMMQVMHHVGLPISEKQRAYFTKSR